MKWNCRIALLVAGTLCLCGVSAHEEVIEVGRSSTGKIAVRLDFPQPIELPASIFPGISGYATGEFGIHSVVADDPAEDLYQFSSEANFRFILLSKDAGMEVWNDTGSGFMGIGDSFYVGVAPFDTHPVWNLVNGANGGFYSLSLKIRDLNGIYSDSDPFELAFTPLKPLRLEIISDVQSVTLRWPATAHDWELQTAQTLRFPSWTTVTNELTLAGTNVSLTLSRTNTVQFFRLRLP